MRHHGCAECDQRQHDPGLAAITAENPALSREIAGGQEYQIGYFILKPDGTQLYDSGRVSIGSAAGNQFKINVPSVPAGEDVKVAVQFFRVDKNNPDAGSGVIKDDEARELEQLVSISK